MKRTSYKILIGVPSSSESVSAATLESLQYSASFRDNDIVTSIQGLSLLARNFNLLFLKAIKYQMDYFILLHADVGVTYKGALGSWVDVLIKLAVDGGFSAVSAVCPIKNHEGYTSTGMIADKRNAHGIRRLTMTELKGMPRVITRDMLCDKLGLDRKIAGAMLINTGCLLMDCKAFASMRWPGFQICDMIEWSKRGTPRCYTLPEDWAFSAWMHEHGVPYVATTAVNIVHYGGTAYSTQGKPWGVEHDSGESLVSPGEWREGDYDA